MSICAPKPFGSKFLKGGYSYYPLWWYGQKSKLHDMSGHGNDLTPSGAYFDGQGYYFDGVDDYLEDASGRKVLYNGTYGSWHSIYLTEGTVPSEGSIRGTGTKIRLNDLGTSPKITGKIVLRPKYCPNLIYLRCCLNDLSAIDVSGLSQLYYYNCAFNNISVLNVGKAKKLLHLYCDNNNISIIDITGAILLKYCNLFNNSLDQFMVDTVLCTLASYDVNDGVIRIYGNTAPSATGIACRDELVSRGWTVETD